jgi:hypothetical protein
MEPSPDRTTAAFCVPEAYRKAGGDMVARYEGHMAQYLGDGHAHFH